MVFQSFAKSLVSCVVFSSNLFLLSIMSSPLVLSQSATPFKAGTYNFRCTNVPPDKTVSEYSIKAEKGVIFYGKYNFIAFDDTLLLDYVPFSYPANFAEGSITTINEAESVLYYVKAGQTSQSGLVGLLPAIYYPAGQVVPRFQTASISLKKTPCATASTPPPSLSGEVTIPISLEVTTVELQDTPYDFQLSSGEVVNVQPDGTITFQNSGLKFKVTFQNGQYVWSVVP
jgi:hypothetical protein